MISKAAPQYIDEDVEGEFAGVNGWLNAAAGKKEFDRGCKQISRITRISFWFDSYGGHIHIAFVQAFCIFVTKKHSR